MLGREVLCDGMVGCLSRSMECGGNSRLQVRQGDMMDGLIRRGCGRMIGCLSRSVECGGHSRLQVSRDKWP